MTSQERGDLLLAQWRLLWWMSAAERDRMLGEVDADYSFEEQMKAVTREMEAA